MKILASRGNPAAQSLFALRHRTTTGKLVLVDGL